MLSARPLRHSTFASHQLLAYQTIVTFMMTEYGIAEILPRTCDYSAVKSQATREEVKVGKYTGCRTPLTVGRMKRSKNVAVSPTPFISFNLLQCFQHVNVVSSVGRKFIMWFLNPPQSD